ncbi:hypothetical protein E6H36_03270 [Candidatus Bathyarchaeota archaeon]|nr:MAG: hypothetical protein E6H36_03270 [Candidatus Bathyarchaeota archaeon]
MLNANITRLQTEIDQNSNLDNQQILGLNAQLSQLQSTLNQLTSLSAQTSAQIASLQTKISLLQQSLSESLVVNQPGALNFTVQGFDINVTNTGAVPVNITQVTITNISPTGSVQCPISNPCILTGTSNPGISNQIVKTTDSRHMIKVNGLTINDGSGYKVGLTSANGRAYGFYFPWPLTPPSSGNGGFVASVGPLAIFLDFKSFNFTQGSQTASQSAFCVPSTSSLVFWIRASNIATDSSVKLRSPTMMQMQPYTANGFGVLVRVWIDDPSTLNPNTVVAYNETTNPYVLPAANPNGPAVYAVLKFSATSQNGVGSVAMGQDNNWITFIGFYYEYRGQSQGQTIAFVDLKSTASWPSSC